MNKPISVHTHTLCTVGVLMCHSVVLLPLVENTSALHCSLCLAGIEIQFSS